MENTESIIERGNDQTHMKVDRESGFIRDVQLHADQSVNGYRYSEKAMRSIASLYESGVSFFANHGEVGLEQLLGCPRNIRVVKESGQWKIRGDAELDQKHALYESIMEHAEKRPHILRFSHEIPPGKATLKREGSETIVDDVSKVRKISLIAESGGVNKGLYESENKDSEMTISSVKELREAHSDFVKIICEEALSECACQKEGGSVDQAIALQNEVDALKVTVSELQEKLDEHAAEKALQERRAAVIQEAADQKRSLSDAMLDMILELKESEDREERIKKIISDLPEIREDDQTDDKKDDKKPRQRSTITGDAPKQHGGRNPFVALT